MTLSRKHLSFALGAALLTGGVFVQSSVLGDEQGAGTFPGSFQLQVEVDSPPGFDAFPVLMTIVPGGGVVATRPLYIGASPAGGLLDTPNHGAWERLGDHTFAVTMIGISQGAPGNPILPDGALFATEKIVWEATYNPHSGAVSGPWQSTFTDAGGNVLFTAGGTITGTSIQAETLP